MFVYVYACSLSPLPHHTVNSLRAGHLQSWGPLHSQSELTDWLGTVLKECRLSEERRESLRCLNPGLTRCLEMILAGVLWNCSSEVGLGFKYLNRLFPESSWGEPLYLAWGKCAYLILKKLNIKYLSPVNTVLFYLVIHIFIMFSCKHKIY